MKHLARDLLVRTLPLVVRRKDTHPGRLQRVLLVRPDHIGDVLFTTPALRLLRSSLPDAHIAVLVGPWSRAVLENNSNVDELITCDFPWFNRRKKASLAEPYVDLRELVKRLRSCAFDAAVNLRFDFWWGAAAIYLAGIPRRDGYDIASCGPFLTHRYPYERGRHEAVQNIALIQQFLGLPQDRDKLPQAHLEFAATEEDERFAADYLLARGAREGDVLVALHPGSGSPAKQWPAEKFARVGNSLSRAYNCVTIVTGAFGERALVNDVASRIEGRCIAAAGDTSLGQLAAVFRRCKLAIGVDSGGMHLAAAVGTPTIHLYGPSDPCLFGPFGDGRYHKVLHASLPCSPCGRFDFAPPSRGVSDCMAAITVEQVLREAASILGDTGA